MAIQYCNYDIKGTLAVSGNATFAGSVVASVGPIKVGNKISMETDGTLDWGNSRDYGTLTWSGSYAYIVGQSGKGLIFQTNGSSDVLTLDTSQKATFVSDVGLGGTGLYTALHSLNIDGTGLSIKNDTSGSSNNWSSIKNTATASSSNLVFTTGVGTSLTLNHDTSATFGSGVTVQGNLAMGNNDITALNGITFENGCILDDSIGAEYLKFKYNGANAGGMQIFDNENTIQGYLYASGAATSEFGLLSGAGQWGVRTKENAETGLYFNNSQKIVTNTSGVTINGNSTVTNGGSYGSAVTITAGHASTLFSLQYPGFSGSNQASIDSWASEPGVTYNGSGIGANIAGSPYYGRRVTNYGQTYLRFIDGQAEIYTGASATGTASTAVRRFFISPAGFATFTNVPIVGTATAGDNSTKAASTGFVTAAAAATVQSVGATAPVTSSGGTTPTIAVTTATVSSSSSSLATGAQIQTAIDTATTGALKFIGEWDASGLGGGGSPDLTAAATHIPGSYYIVGVAGSATPNGSGTTPNSWAVGDWCVRADLATDTWQKIDNTQVGNVTGSRLTTRGVTFWSGVSSISSTSITIDGSSNLEVGTATATQDRAVRVLAGDAYKAGFEAHGNSQGTGYLFVGQSTTYGGGMFYNGDGSPAFATGEVTDTIGFYRKDNGTNKVVFYYSYANNAVVFKGGISITDDLSVTGGNITLANTGRIQGIDTVTDGTDAANKTYVDNAVSTGVGAFLPLTAGSTKPLTGDLFIEKNTPILHIGDSNTSTGNARINFFSKNNSSANAFAIQFNKDTGIDRLEFIDGSGSANFKFNNGGSAEFASYIAATQFRPTNIVTNKIVKFNGTALDDSTMTDDGTNVSMSGNLTIGGILAMADDNITGVNNLEFNTGSKFDDNGGANYIRLTYNGAGAGGLQVLDNDNTLQGYLYASGAATSEFGLLTGAGEWGVRTVENGLVELRHDNSVRLQTTTAGISVTGDLVVGGGDITGSNAHKIISNSANNNQLVLGDVSDGDEITSIRLKTFGRSNILLQDETTTLDDNTVFIKGTLSTTAPATFLGLVTSTGELTKRTPAQLLSDIGGAPASGGAYLPLAGGTLTGNLFQATGYQIIPNELSMGDNKKALFGNGDDLQIYHDSSHSYIKDVGIGDLKISSNTVRIESDGAENMIIASANGSVNLYYNNNLKLQTTNTGVDITGTCQPDALTMLDNEYIRLGNSGDLEIYHDGSTSFIKDVGTGNLEMWADGAVIMKSGNGTETKAVFDTNGSVDLYYNNSKKFETTNTGVTVEGLRVDNAGDLGLEVLPSDGTFKIGDIDGVSDGANIQGDSTQIMIKYESATVITFFTSGNQTNSGSVTATNFILSSDERLKENIKKLEPKVISTKWKTFNLKDSEEDYRVGVIAQELEVEHPEFVVTNDEGFKSVKYIDLLISKIAELEARLEKAGL